MRLINRAFYSAYDTWEERQRKRELNMEPKRFVIAWIDAVAWTERDDMTIHLKKITASTLYNAMEQAYHEVGGDTYHGIPTAENVSEAAITVYGCSINAIEIERCFMKDLWVENLKEGS